MQRRAHRSLDDLRDSYEESPSVRSEGNVGSPTGFTARLNADGELDGEALKRRFLDRISDTYPHLGHVAVSRMFERLIGGGKISEDQLVARFERHYQRTEAKTVLLKPLPEDELEVRRDAQECKTELETVLEAVQAYQAAKGTLFLGFSEEGAESDKNDLLILRARDIVLQLKDRWQRLQVEDSDEDIPATPLSAVSEERSQLSSSPLEEQCLGPPEVSRQRTPQSPSKMRIPVSPIPSEIKRMALDPTNPMSRKKHSSDSTSTPTDSPTILKTTLQSRQYYKSRSSSVEIERLKEVSPAHSSNDALFDHAAARRLPTPTSPDDYRAKSSDGKRKFDFGVRRGSRTRESPRHLNPNLGPQMLNEPPNFDSRQRGDSPYNHSSKKSQSSESPRPSPDSPVGSDYARKLLRDMRSNMDGKKSPMTPERLPIIQSLTIDDAPDEAPTTVERVDRVAAPSRELSRMERSPDAANAAYPPPGNFRGSVEFTPKRRHLRGTVEATLDDVRGPDMLKFVAPRGYQTNGRERTKSATPRTPRSDRRRSLSPKDRRREPIDLGSWKRNEENRKQKTRAYKSRSTSVERDYKVRSASLDRAYSSRQRRHTKMNGAPNRTRHASLEREGSHRMRTTKNYELPSQVGRRVAVKRAARLPCSRWSRRSPRQKQRSQSLDRARGNSALRGRSSVLAALRFNPGYVDAPSSSVRSRSLVSARPLNPRWTPLVPSARNAFNRQYRRRGRSVPRTYGSTALQPATSRAGQMESKRLGRPRTRSREDLIDDISSKRAPIRPGGQHWSSLGEPYSNMFKLGSNIGVYDLKDEGWHLGVVIAVKHDMRLVRWKQYGSQWFNVKSERLRSTHAEN